MKTVLKLSLSMAMALAATHVVAAPTTAGITQFSTRMYSEGLGRAPDKDAWNNILNNININGCSKDGAKFFARNILLSTEFASLTGNDYNDKLMRLYRGALFRDPDSAGLSYWANIGQTTGNWSGIVDGILNSPEFDTVTTSYICNQTANGESVIGMQKTTTPIRVVNSNNGDFNGGTRAQLQALIDSASAAYARDGIARTVSINQGALINITDGQTLVVGSGVTLTTYGSPLPGQYPKMARISRASTMNGPLIALQSNANLRNIWVDGNRSAYYPKQDGVTYDASTEQNNVQVRGVNVKVENNFITDPAAWSALYYSSNYGPCNSGRVAGNLVTLYGSGHYAINKLASWSDGISIACGNTEVTNNSVIDATDVGIIVFRNPANDPLTGVNQAGTGAPQNSTVHDNIVVSAGNSAYGALATDGQTLCQRTPFPAGTSDATKVSHAVQCTNANQSAFTGTRFERNMILGNTQTHIDILMALGTRAWFGDQSITGQNATFTNNSTVGGPIPVTTGIMVAGMRNATVTNNALNLAIIPKTGCPSGFAQQSRTYQSGVYTFDSSSGLNYSGNLNNGSATAIGSSLLSAPCVGH